MGAYVWATKTEPPRRAHGVTARAAAPRASLLTHIVDNPVGAGLLLVLDSLVLLELGRVAGRWGRHLNAGHAVQSSSGEERRL